MRLVEEMQRGASVVLESVTARNLAHRMRADGVGSLLVVNETGRLVGIVTDRDLLCRVISEQRDPDQTLAGDIMSQPVATVERGVSLEMALAEMRRRKLRRIPVVENDQPLGMVALDDAIVLLGSELQNLGRATNVRHTERA